MAFLTIQNLQKTFGTTQVLNGIDLSIKKGEFVSLLGPSGSGKTTILRCVAGLETPDQKSGSIQLDGVTFSGEERFLKPEMRNLGMVFQNYAVWPHMNVADNVGFPLVIRSQVSRKELNQKVRETLELVKLDQLSHRFAHELSGGQQQRVALARALVMSPKALLLDEPLSNLDALLREELGTEIRRLQQEIGLTTILVTHDQKEALSLSDRIVLLNNGKIDAQGTPESLFRTPPTAFSASFISGGQRLKFEGQEAIYLPRLWKTSSRDTAATPGSAPGFRIDVRVFRGNEYEYWASGSAASDQVRFFSSEKYEVGKSIQLHYEVPQI